MKKFSAPFVFLLLALSAVVVSIRADLPKGLSGKKISFPYHEKGKLKALFTGDNAKQITGSQVLITKFAMKTFRNGDTNQIELIAEAPECLLDRSNSVVSSSGSIK